ncbi:MAG: TOBE domain-containing protein, partial [Methanobacterium sp.]
VADFIGIENVMNGEVIGSENDLVSIKIDSITIFAITEKRGNVNLSIRPDEITISKDKIKTSARNNIQGEVQEIIDTGSLIMLIINSGELFTVFVTRESLSDLGITIGTLVWMYFKASAVHVF